MRRWWRRRCFRTATSRDRFLPDKAIDLVDEAAARLRTEIDSMPAELDEILRRIMQLEIEREALKKETDAASKDRLKKLEKELADLQAESDALQGAVAGREGRPCSGCATLREQMEQTKVEIEKAERQYDLNRAAELKYGKLAELERQLKDRGNAPGREAGRQAADQGRSGRGRYRRRWSAAGPACRCPSCWKARCRSCCIWKTSCTSA